MEHSRKLMLVPEDRLQAVEHMSELDKQMKHILQNKNLNESEKAILYLQILQKYTNFSVEKPSPEKVPSEQLEAPIERPDVEPVIKTEKLDIEEKATSAAPRRYRDLVKDIFMFLKQQHLLQWSSKGELIYKDKLHPNTNIVLLVNDLLRNRKKAPIGRNVFLNALNEAKFPKHLDVNKKLYKNLKNVKPIMYARRNEWIKI